MSMRMKLKLRSKSKSKVYPSQAKTFRKGHKVGEVSRILVFPEIVDSVCEHQTIDEDIESNLPFFRLEDRKRFDELLLKEYPEYTVDSKGFELVDMSFEDPKSDKFQLGTESFESLLVQTSDEQTPSEMNSAETLVPVDFVDMWEKECSEEIKEVQEIVVGVKEIVVEVEEIVENNDIVVKDQRTSDQIGISWAINRANQLAQLKPKVARREAKKTTAYSDSTNRTKTADKENKESKLAWIVPIKRNCKKPYINQYSDRVIQANSHKTEDNDSFDFGFLLSNKY
jgi:hypothetical protein